MARGNDGARKPAPVSTVREDLSYIGDVLGVVRSGLHPGTDSAPVFRALNPLAISLTGAGYTQDFDTLASTGTSSVVPADWFFNEVGGSAPTTYGTGTGSSTTGNTYSFGAAASTERAFGSLASDTVTEISIGASFTNNSGGTITSLLISYFGEQWRNGDNTTQQKLDFQISFDATSLTTGSWQDVNQLDFLGPSAIAGGAPLDGNANRTNISHTITGLGISAGATFWIRWVDVNDAGSDHGLAIDDFSIDIVESNDAPTVSFNPPVAPVGGETLVNTTTAGFQIHPSIAALSGGGYVVTWTAENQGGDTNFGIWAQRYNASGVAQGGEIHVNTTNTSVQFDSSVVGLTGGGFVVVWHGNGPGDGEGIFMQRYDATGGALGLEMRVNTFTGNTQDASAVGALSGGGYVVAWTSQNQDGTFRGIYAQRYDADGVAQGSETLVNTTTTGDEFHPAVAGLAGGGYVIIWTGQDSDAGGVFLQRYDAAGVAQGGQVRANTTTAGDQYFTDGSIAGNAVAGLTGGGFVVVWTGTSADFSEFEIYMQRYDANGVALGVETRVNTTTAGFQFDPTVTALAGGGYVVTWEGEGPGDSGGVFAQRFDANGVAQGSEFRVNTTTSSTQGEQAVVGLADGGFVFTWQSPGNPPRYLFPALQQRLLRQRAGRARSQGRGLGRGQRRRERRRHRHPLGHLRHIERHGRRQRRDHCQRQRHGQPGRQRHARPARGPARRGRDQHAQLHRRHRCAARLGHAHCLRQ